MSRAFAIAACVLLASASAAAAAQPRVIPAVAQPQWVGHEPMFEDIARQADVLRGEVVAYRTTGLAAEAAAKPLPDFDRFQADVAALAALDMKGHLRLVKTGQDADLKCILKGMSQDLPVKMKAVVAAKTGKDEDLALRDMFYLLRDNVQVITTPPKAGSVSGT